MPSRLVLRRLCLAVHGALLLGCATATAPAPAPASPLLPTAPPAAAALVREADALLDTLHSAAARADGGAYFALFAPDAVFLGTDARERWSLPAFRAYAEPYFSRGQGWTYTSTQRHLTASPQGDVVWFDERLESAKYGEVRGSGVLCVTPEGLRIAQYVLSFPVPNELAEDLAARVRERKP